MRSDIDSASSWSWVTKIVVMPRLRCSARISSRSATRMRASSADSGSSSSRICGLGRERAGERDALLLAARQLIGIALGELRQLDHRQHLVDARLELGRRPARDLEAEADVGGDRHVGKQGVGLEHHADRALVGAQMGHVLAVDANFARARRLEARDHAQSRRLAAAAWSEEGDELAALDREIEIPDDRVGAEGLANAGQGEKRHGRQS